MNRIKRNEIIELLSQHLRPLGYECVETEWDAGDQTLRIFIDGPQGIVMDDCMKANHLLVELGELDEAMGRDFRLEVSSPGIERPLRTQEHFAKAVGEQVRLKLTDKVDNRKQGVGKLLEVNGDGHLTLELPSGPWIVPLELLQSANLVYDWNQL